MCGKPEKEYQYDPDACIKKLCRKIPGVTSAEKSKRNGLLTVESFCGLFESNLRVNTKQSEIIKE